VSQGCTNNKGQGYTTKRCRNEHETKRCYYNTQSLNYGKDQKIIEIRQQKHINESIKKKIPQGCLLSDDQQPISIKPTNNIKIQIKPKIKSEVMNISVQPTDKFINSNLVSNKSMSYELINEEHHVFTNNNMNNEFLNNIENNNQISEIKSI
jgi:hypothetical protein